MRSQKSEVLLTQIILAVIMIIFSIMVLYPFLYSLAYSLSDSVAVATRNVTIFPIGFTIENYSNVFKNHRIFNSFYVSILRTVCGALWTLTVTGLASYGISKRDIPFNRLLTFFLIIPMYVTGGLIPTYVLMFKLKLYNNFLVYILPHGFWAFNMLLMRTYFDTIPVEMEESARLDGAGDLRIFARIILPVSMPIIAVIAMYSGVWQWNSWFDAMLYITRPELKPLQAVLQQMILESYTSTLQLAQGGHIAEKQASPEGIRLATMMITVAPIVIVYPFFQKHFVRGVMIGAVKA
jgi:putative aldouronate transport system permease protein